MKNIIVLLSLLSTCLCLAPYSEFGGGVVFTNVGKSNEMYLEFEKSVEILFLHKLSVKDYLYKIEISTSSKNEITVQAFNGDTTSAMKSETVKSQGKHPLKISWESGVVYITQNNAYVSMLGVDVRTFNVSHLTVIPKTVGSVVFKDTYTFIANVDQVCIDPKTYPFLVCDMDILPEKSVPSSSSLALVPVMRGKMFKTSNTAESYEIKIVLNSTDRDPYLPDINQQYNSRNPIFYIIKRDKSQVKSNGHFFIGKPITLGVNFGKSYTFVNNDNIDQAIQWHEQEAEFQFENLNKLILQNSKSLVSKNNCEFKCVNKNKRGFFGRIATLAKSFFSLEEYCRATELDRN